MPRYDVTTKRPAGRKSPTNQRRPAGQRFTVGLTPTVARQVERYAETVETSMSKAIAALVKLGLESQQDRKREFFKRLKENLHNEEPDQQDRLIDEFRALILGR